MKKEGASAQQQMIRVAEQLNGLHSFQQTFWVSALRAQGMTKLKDFLTQRFAFPLTGGLFTNMESCCFTETAGCLRLLLLKGVLLCRIALVFNSCRLAEKGFNLNNFLPSVTEQFVHSVTDITIPAIRLLAFGTGMLLNVINILM